MLKEQPANTNSVDHI